MNDAREEINDCDVLVEDAEITAVGPGIEASAEHVIDARGCVVIPGLINTHNHTYQSLYRAIPETLDVGFVEWIDFLSELWIRKPFSPDAIHAAAAANLGELLLSGCTLSADQHYPYYSGKSLDYVDKAIEAADLVGIRFHPARGCVTLGTSNGGLVTDVFAQAEEEVLAHAQELISRYHDPQPGAMVRIVLAPLGIYSDTETIFREMRELAGEHPGVHCHTHLHEIADYQFSLDHYGVPPLGFMERVGWVGPEFLYYHYVAPRPSDVEIARVAEAGTFVSHCVASDLRLSYGLTPVRELMNLGGNVCLGTTGPASNAGADMVTEMKLVWLVHRLKSPDPADWLSARDVLWLATRQGARALGRDDLGSLEPGKAADLAIFDLNRLDMAGGHDPVAALIAMGSCHYTKATIVAGRIVAEDGSLTMADQEEIAQAANRWALQLASD